MPCSSSTAPAGTQAPPSPCPTTSPWSACPPTRPNSIPPKTSGITCARTSSPSASTAPTRPSSTLPVGPGTISLPCPPDSPPSPRAIGLPYDQFCRLVLHGEHHGVQRWEGGPRDPILRRCV